MNSSNDKIFLEKNPEIEAKLEKYGLLPKEPVITRNELRELIKKVDEKIVDKKKGQLDLPNPGTAMMLTYLTEVALLGIMSLASYIAENGVGLFPEKEEKELEWAKKFSFETFLRLVNGSDILTILFRDVAKNCDTTEKNRKTITEVLKLTALLFALYAASQGDEERFKELIEEASETIQKGIKKIEGVVEQEQISLHLKQANLALEKGEFDQFLKACYGVLEVLNITPENMKKDLKEMNNLSTIFAEAFAASDDEAVTAMSQAM